MNNIGSTPALNAAQGQSIQEQKPMNVIDRIKVQGSNFKDVFTKSDDNTKSKINMFLPAVSIGGLGLMAIFKKHAIPKFLGAALSVLASSAAIYLNFSQKGNVAKETPLTELAPDIQTPIQSEALQVPDNAAEVQAMNLIAQNDGAKAPAADPFKQLTQG